MIGDFILYPRVDQLGLFKFAKVGNYLEAVLLQLFDDFKLGEEPLFIFDCQQVEGFDPLVQRLDFKANLHVEDLAAGNFLDIAPAQDKLLFLLDDALLLERGVDVVLWRAQAEADEEEEVLGDDYVAVED